MLHGITHSRRVFCGHPVVIGIRSNIQMYEYTQCFVVGEIYVKWDVAQNKPIN